MLSYLGTATPKKEGAGGNPTTGRLGGHVIFQSSSRPEGPPSFKCWTCLNCRRAHLDLETGVSSTGAQALHVQGGGSFADTSSPACLCLNPAVGPRAAPAPGMWFQPRWPSPEGSVVAVSLFIFLLSFSRLLSLFCFTFILDWTIVDLLCWFRWIATWFNYAYIYFLLDSFPM